MNKNIYTIHGPFKIKVDKLPGGKCISVDAPDLFWRNKVNRHLSKRKGVYVYAIKPSKSQDYTPYYVGQATKAFDKEIFQSHKLDKYHHALCDYKSGYPVMFFVVFPKRQGNINQKEIKNIESDLIFYGKKVNKNLKNTRGTKLPQWEIAGVINSTKKQSAKERVFGRMFGINYKA